MTDPTTTNTTATTETTGTMKGFVVSNAGDTHGSLRNDLPIPTPGPGEALIRVLRAGVCNTDLEILKGYMGFTGILGHEFVGIVEEVHRPEDGSDTTRQRHDDDTTTASGSAAG
eukprot:jgi/Psemu1/3381/gm1.3381_g